MKNKSVLSENIEMLNAYATKNKVSEYVKQNLIEMKGEIGKSTKTFKVSLKLYLLCPCKQYSPSTTYSTV